MDVDGALDGLFSKPLDTFTEARNALVADAKKAADDDAARSIKQLKKPTIGAWTLNQLVRRHPDVMSELVEVRDRLENAGSPKELRDLSGRRRELVTELTVLAKEILEDSPYEASHATLEKVSQGLLAGGSDEERELLQKGRLSREPSSPGLEAFGFEAGGVAAAPSVSLKEQREVQKLRRDAERLQQEAARLEQEAAFAEEQAGRAREKADDAHRDAESAREKADEAAEAAGL